MTFVLPQRFIQPAGFLPNPDHIDHHLGEKTTLPNGRLQGLAFRDGLGHLSDLIAQNHIVDSRINGD